MNDPEKRTRLLDANSAWFGASTSTLMENAGKGVAQEVEKRYSDKGRILVLCGLGNNGGDGFVAARHLSERRAVTVALAGRPEQIKGSAAQQNWKAIQKKRVEIKYITKPEEARALREKDYNLVVDALLGIGRHGKLQEPVASIVNAVNAWKLPKIAVDIPTGYGTKQALKCNLVLSMHFAKTPKAKVIDIGIPAEWNCRVGPAHVKLLRERDENAHKGQNGKVLIVAGGKQYHGSAIFASLAASQLVDLVWACTEKENIPAVKKWSPTAICYPLEKALQKAKEADSVLVGPGLDITPKNRKILDSLLRLRKNTILDASALDMATPNQLHARCCVTPHIGEFMRFFKKEKNRSLAFLSKNYPFVIVLKGVTDQIAFDGTVYENRKKANALMTAGGTGDVLAGVITAFAAKNSLHEAALAGTFLNGYAGEMLARKSAGFNALQLANSVGKALKEAQSTQSK